MASGTTPNWPRLWASGSGSAVSPDNVAYLIADKLAPAGLVKDDDGRDPVVRKANPLLGLRLRFKLTNEAWTNRVAAPFSFLFRPWIVAPVVVAFIAVVAWVLFIRGVGEGARALLYSPGFMLGTFALVIASASFHELGHAAGCRYSGGRPGVMGCGMYLVWPAFYTDVTDAYRLDRAGRLRTDLGGLYFNAIFVLGTFAAWAVTGAEALLMLIPLQLFQMVHQLLPFVRMDGYHILSDLVGVPDLFARIKPTLLGFVPWRRTSDKALVLKPWVRVVVAGWVLTVVPLLLFSLLMVVISGPRMVATAWDSAGLQWQAVSRAFGTGEWILVAVGVLGIVAITLPIAGSSYALARFGRRSSSWAWTSAGNVRFGQPSMALVGAVAAAGLAFTLWPSGEYRPLQPGERITAADALQAASSLRTGRPGLTPQREAELGGAPAKAWPLGEGQSQPAPAPETGDPSTAPSTTAPPTTVAANAPAPAPAPAPQPAGPATTSPSAVTAPPTTTAAPATTVPASTTTVAPTTTAVP